MRKIILLGDSIARGVVRENPEARYRISPHSFAKNCEEIMDVQIDNYARLGSTVHQGLISFERVKPKISEASEVWLLFGGNDSNMSLSHIDDSSEPLKYQPNVSLQDFQKHYGELIQNIQQLGPKVTLLSLPPVAVHKFMKNVQKTIATSMGRCKWHKFIHYHPETLSNWHEVYNLAVWKLAHQYRVPIIDITTPFLKKGNCEPYFCDDGMHPNAQGHLLITNAITQGRPDLVSLKRMWEQQQKQSIQLSH